MLARALLTLSPLLVLAGCGRLSPTMSVPSAETDKAAPGGPTAASLAAHPFWTKKQTPPFVDELVRTIQGQKGGAFISVDDQGNVDVSPDGSDAEGLATKNSVRRALLAQGLRDRTRPAALGPRWWFVDTKEWANRLSEGEVLVLLKVELDVADYKPAPSRKPAR